jgi:hypothetical protein
MCISDTLMQQDVEILRMKVIELNKICSLCDIHLFKISHFLED